MVNSSILVFDMASLMHSLTYTCLSIRMHPRAAEFDALSVKEYVLANIPVDSAQTEVLLFIQTILACTSFDSCSFLFFLFVVASGGGMEALGDGDRGAQKWKVRGGTQQICNLLAARLTATANGKVKTLLSTKVVAVYQDELSPLAGGTVALSTRVVCISATSDYEQPKETIISCKKVIFALSPTLIARQAIAFHPPLPALKQRLYKGMTMGACVKVVVAYSTAFWLIGAVAQTEAGAEAPELGLQPPKQVSIEQFSQMGPAHNIFLTQVGELPALVCLITGAAAVAHSALHESERRRAVLAQLARMYLSPETESLAFEPLVYAEKDW